MHPPVNHILPEKRYMRGFLTRALDKTPGVVLGIIGACFGFVLALAAGVMLLGLQGPMLRVVEAYASRIEAAAAAAAATGTALEEAGRKATEAAGGLERANQMAVKLVADVDALAVRLMTLAGRVDTTENRVTQLERRTDLLFDTLPPPPPVVQPTPPPARSRPR